VIAKTLTLIFFILLAPFPTLADASLEHTLAVIDSDTPVSDDHFTVASFRALLVNLSLTYGEKKRDISNKSVAAQDQLIERGIKEKILTIMEGMDRIVTDRVARHTYSAILSAYIALRIQGQSHPSAIDGIVLLLNDMEELEGNE